MIQLKYLVNEADLKRGSMNIKKLLFLEDEFLSIYPLGFQSEDMIQVGKKHNVNKLSKYVLDVCSEENLSKGIEVVDDVAKIISKSSMVSVFEKMRFRDLVKVWSGPEKALFIYSVRENIYGDEEEGFNQLVYLLKPYKLAKWTIITAFRAYYNLNYDVFMKPTTVKKIINYLELDDIKYVSTPDFELYTKYRDYINTLKQEVNISLSPNNPAFSGFLMISID